MSIIRFRTAIRDTMDLVFIFLSLAIGMACGVGLTSVALLGSLIAGMVVVSLTYTHFGAPRRRHFLLQIIRQSSEQTRFKPNYWANIANRLNWSVSRMSGQMI